MCSYGNTSSRTGQVRTSPVQAVTRPPAGEDIDGGTRVRHDIATMLIMLVLDAKECSWHVFSCPMKMRLFLPPGLLQSYRVFPNIPSSLT